jgi:fibronectin-binding autotransporter adhesin
MRHRCSALLIAMSIVAISLLNCPARANSNIESGSTYSVTNLNSSVNPDFKGGTLQLNSSATVTDNFSVENYPNNTIDSDGNMVTMSGAFTGTGPLTFTDSVGGGSVMLTNGGNTFSGLTTINSSAALLLSGPGTISASSSLTDNGTFDISSTSSGASIISLTGTGTVNLGGQNLTLTDGAGTFSGTISGTGGLIISGGTEELSGANGYTGGTTITKGTLEIGDGITNGSIVGNVVDNGTLEFNRTDNVIFSGILSGSGGVSQLGTGSLTLTAVNSYQGVTTIQAGGTLALASGASIAASSSIIANGTLDISATGGTSIESLSGIGVVQLGAQTITITAGSTTSTATTGSFSGIIAGSGGVTLNSGTELLGGANTYTGPTTVNGGTLELGASVITYNVNDNGTLAFDSSTAIAMSGVVSGPGGLAQSGSGVTTISTVQTYAGPTTISLGTLAISGSGAAIASSSGVIDNGIFDVSAATSTAQIISLAGAGTVNLGSQSLVLTNASGTFSGVISGTGGLTLAGGNETLSGTNSYTGPTIIASGTLSVAGASTLATSSSVIDNAVLDISGATGNQFATTISITSLSGSGMVTLGSKTLNLTGAANTFSGSISGSGGLTVSGGNEVLTGANIYTGITTISAGTLSISQAGNLSTASAVSDSGILDISTVTGGSVTVASLSGAGTVNLGAKYLNLASASDYFSGAISGTGGLIVSGGTESLSGTNSYTGGTTINAGTLQLGHGAMNGSVVGNVVDNGTLAFDLTGSTVFAGVISGSGVVMQIGSGTTILTAANTYSGGTTINAGTLQIGNGSTTGSISGAVTDNGTLAFGRTDTTTFAGTILGTGGVTVVSGTTVFTALNSYAGATTINSLADMALSGSGSIATSGLVTDNGVFDVSATTSTPQITSLVGSGTVNLGSQSLVLTNGSGTFSGTIVGSGGLILNGGLQTVSGTNSYSGSTTINGGTLAVNGTITSSSGVTINSGGTLGGTGTVPSVSVSSGGTISPGVAGAGTLHVNGSVSFAPGSNMAVQVASGSASTLEISGAAALNGTLSVASVDGTYDLGQKLTVLTANSGVTGTFNLAQIQSNGAQFSSALSYDADDVYLQINLAKLSPLLSGSATSNESHAVGGIDAAIAAGETPSSAISNLGSLSSATLTSDAGQLSGEIGSDVFLASLSLFDPFLDTIFDHIADGQPNGLVSRGPPRKDDEVWASGFGGTNLVTGEPDTVGTNKIRSNSIGVAAGSNWNISQNFMLGAALSAGTNNFHIASDLGSGKTDAIQGGIYGLIQFRPRLYGSFAGVLALDKVSTSRTMTVSGTDVLASNFSGILFGGRYETGAEFGWGTPYVAIDDELDRTPVYKETATSGTSDFALSYAAHLANDPDTEVGIRERADIASRSWVLKLSDKFAWLHDMSATPDARVAFTGLPDSSFTAYGARFAKNSFLFSLGMDLQYGSGFGFYTHFNSKLAANSQSYTGIGGLDFAW